MCGIGVYYLVYDLFVSVEIGCRDIVLGVDEIDYFLYVLVGEMF